jgi:hypothetical protein
MAAKYSTPPSTQPTTQLFEHTMADASLTEPFHPFFRLPAELRLHIWACALPVTFAARDIHSQPIRSMTLVEIDGDHYIHDSLPVIFFINSEARQEAARMDGGAWYPPNGASDTYRGPRAYINKNKDIWHRRFSFT